MVQPARGFRPQRSLPASRARGSRTRVSRSDVFAIGPTDEPVRRPAAPTEFKEPVLGYTPDVDNRIVGEVIRQAEFMWMAFRTATWGGTNLVAESLKDARDFIQAACGGTYLREQPIELADGTTGFRYWNDSVAAPINPT